MIQAASQFDKEDKKDTPERVTFSCHEHKACYWCVKINATSTTAPSLLQSVCCVWVINWLSITTLREGTMPPRFRITNYTSTRYLKYTPKTLVKDVYKNLLCIFLFETRIWVELFDWSSLSFALSSFLFVIAR